jgi:hypothetical protein
MLMKLNRQDCNRMACRLIYLLQKMVFTGKNPVHRFLSKQSRALGESCIARTYISDATAPNITPISTIGNEISPVKKPPISFLFFILCAAST